MTHRVLLTALALVIVALFAVDPLAGVTHGASPAGVAGAPDVWGNLDCKDGATAADAIVILADMAEVGTGQAQYCPLIGSPVSINGAATSKFGDINCDGNADLKDSLTFLKSLSGATASTAGCFNVGDNIQIAQVADAYEPGDPWRDYGNAPDGTPTGYAAGAATGHFPTLPANGGPSHVQNAGATLGETSNVEEAPVPQDTNDGVVYVDLHACAASSALVMINTEGLTADQRANGVYLSMFADWNRDGAWAGSDSCAPEAAVVNKAIDVTATQGVDLIEVDFTAGAQVDEFWGRFTLTTQPYTPGQQDLQGETEDYHILAGQVPVAGDGPVQPQEEPLLADFEFLCKGTVVPHGDGSKMTLDIEQTQESKQSGFKVQGWSGSTAAVKKPGGSKVNDVTVTNSDVKMENLKDGRTRIRLTLTVKSTHDGPDRLVGPLVVDIKFTGNTQPPKNKKFEGHISCVFYVDHTDGAVTQQSGKDGFKGGTDRVDDTPGVVENHYYFIQHGQTKTIHSDATEANSDEDPPKYDKASLTVFGPDGNVVPAAKYKKDAGISDINVPKAGRALVIKTTEDKRPEPVQMIVLRIKGKTVSGTEFTDYYRIVIVHDKGAGYNKLVEKFTQDPKFAGTGKTLGPDEAYAVTYVADQHTLVSLVPPIDQLTFPSETICIEEGNDTILSPIDYATIGEDTSVAGTSTQDVEETTRGGLVLRYPSGASDFLGVYDPYGRPAAQPCDDPSTATNETGYGANSIFAVEHPTWCFNAYVFAELNLQADTARLAYFQHSGPFPLPGGGGYQDATCFAAPDGTAGITARKLNNDNTSDAWYVPYCIPSCPTGTLPSTAKLLIEATGANENILGAVVSPDATKIAWVQSTLTANGTAFVDGQIMEADFDWNTMTLSNQRTLTTKGLNLHPQWSPDSSQIIFDSNRDGNSEIYVMGADGTSQTNITNTPDIQETQPAWQTP